MKSISLKLGAGNYPFFLSDITIPCWKNLPFQIPSHEKIPFPFGFDRNIPNSGWTEDACMALSEETIRLYPAISNSINMG